MHSRRQRWHGRHRAVSTVALALGVVVLLTASGRSSLAQSDAVRLEQSDAARTPYQQVRYDDDFRYLADPARRDDIWDPLK